MGNKLLSEVYSGSLSQRWHHFIEALENNESRILVYMETHSDSKGEYTIEKTEVCFCAFMPSGDIASYYILGSSIPGTWRVHAIHKLMELGVGFFPANDDEK